MHYTIGEFAKKTQVSAHTLRYYEKELLLTPGRTHNGRRFYTENDLTWIGFIKRLKETGMPIKLIQHYARLRRQGDLSLQARMDMLLQHHEEVQKNMALWQEHLQKLNDKIEYYETQIALQSHAH